MIVLVTALNIRGTRQSANAQGLATALKVLVILVLAVLLIAMSARGERQTVWWPAQFSLATISGAATAMIGVSWAYEGWQDVTFSAGETVDPQRTFGRGIVAGTALLIGIYVLANVGYFSALGVDGVASSSRVASDAASTVLGPSAGKVVAAAILISIASAANGIALTLPRLFFAMARDRVFFARLAEVHPRFGTPAAAIIGTGVWSSVLCSRVRSAVADLRRVHVVATVRAGGADDFADRRAPEVRPFRTPGYPLTPIVFVIAALGIVIDTIVAQPVQRPHRHPGARRRARLYFGGAVSARIPNSKFQIPNCEETSP